jgi:ubiquinone/menaquinone biosynthesis C-methylase UbiE
MAQSKPIPAGTRFKEGNAYLSRAYNLQNETEARALYDEWATQYDKDLTSMDYMSPTATVNALFSAISSSSPTASAQPFTILDAGCGTGLVGLALAAHISLNERVRVTIDGLDLSQGMLDVARKTGTYRALEVADLTKRIEKDDGSYDAVLCVGTLTQGHVGPAVLEEFVRVVKKDGVVVATILGDVFVEGGYEKEIERLEASGVVKVDGTDDFGIRKGETQGGKMLVLRKV